MPMWMDHLVALVLTVFFPLRAATFGYRRLLEAAPDDLPRMRRALYAQAILLQWTFAFLLAALWAWQGRPWDALGLIAWEPGALFFWLAGALAIAAWLWFLRRRARREPEALARLVERMHHVERLLPRTRAELRLFYAVSLTAGICEELLYRGYLWWYLGQWLPALPALLVASAIFGLGHAYQGWRGVVTTAVMGVGLGLVYRFSGSLWPAMLIHAVGDAHAGSLAHRALATPGAPAGRPAPSAPGG
jgi:membrane protease YdiL (CAAX protease family)